MFRSKTYQSGLGLALIIFSGTACANLAPVVDITQESTAPLPMVDASNLPLPERVSRVEQQVNNLVQMNLPQQIAELQQQIQQLNGQLQELSHELDVASRQQLHVEALPAVPPVSETPPNPAILKAAKAPPSDAKPSALPPQIDATAYQKAFSLLADKRYDESAAAFKDYLRKYPDGQFVANAHYWLGDIYFQQRNLTEAERELNLVIAQYSASGKAPDAQLKLAIIHAQQGDTDRARRELKTIMDRYPGTPAAQLANIQLQQLNTNTSQ